MKAIPAFPETDYYDEKPIGQNPGMSLRDYFAASALDGLLAGPAIIGNQAAYAKLAYQYADAMMEERVKSGLRHAS